MKSKVAPRKKIVEPVKHTRKALAYLAMSKREDGGSLTRQEQADVAWMEKQEKRNVSHGMLQSVTAMTIEDLTKIQRKTWLEWEEDGLPRNEDGTYNLFLVLPWLKDRLRSEDDALSAAKLSKTEAEARLTWSRGDVVDRKLIPVLKASQARVDMILELNRIIEQLFNEVSHLLLNKKTPIEVRDILQDARCEKMRELVSHQKSLGPGDNVREIIIGESSS